MQLYNMDRLVTCPSGLQASEQTSEKFYEMTRCTFSSHQQKIFQVTCRFLPQSLFLKYLLSGTIIGLQEGCKPNMQEDVLGTQGMSKLTSNTDSFLSRNITVSKFQGVYGFVS